HNNHFGAVLRALPEHILWLERTLPFGLQHMRIKIRDPVRAHGPVPVPPLLDIRLINPANETSNDTDQQCIYKSLQEPPTPLRGPCPLTACVDEVLNLLGRVRQAPRT